MKRADLHFAVSILLFVSICVTAALGYFQSQMELRKFVPHRYAAYTTVCLTLIHVIMNWGKIRRTLGRIARRPK